MQHRSPRPRAGHARVHVHRDIVVWSGGSRRAAVDVWFHPAFGDSRASYRQAFDSGLSRWARLFVHDPPGHGASPPRKSGLTLDDCARQWCELINRFSRSNAVVLVGHSMSGIIASRVAKLLARPPLLVIGVEANLTRRDAYFTGLAARFAEPARFHASLCRRVLRLADCDPSARAFAGSLEVADPLTLWTLGRSVVALKDPGSAFRKVRTAKVHYWDATAASREARAYVTRHGLPLRAFTALGHWPMLKAPDTFYGAIADDIRRLSKGTRAK